MKMIEMEKLLRSCRLCPRECGVNRLEGQRGFCRETAEITAARAALHRWEEPCISGSRGSGAVFFSGCTLGCVFCQNQEIASGNCQQTVSRNRLLEIFLNLQNEGAANINLITAGHFAPQIAEALKAAKGKGLSIPVVYNSGGYEKTETLQLLEGLVDVYLPDFKYMDEELSTRYCAAPDYSRRAKSALAEMVRQRGSCVFDKEGYLKKGVLVRHLILPGHTRDSMAVLKYLYDTYGNQIYISIMNQYTPLKQVEKYPELNRKITRREYEKVLDYALALGISQAYMQEGETAKESFIPAFDFEGL